MAKSPDAFRTISEVAEWLDVPTHVLRFWESRFTQVKPVKRAGGRRYYRPTDMELLGGIKRLLHDDGLTIRGVQKLLREEGVRHVAALSPPLDGRPDPRATGRDNVVPLGKTDPDPEAALTRWPFVDDTADGAEQTTAEETASTDAAKVEPAPATAAQDADTETPAEPAQPQDAPEIPPTPQEDAAAETGQPAAQPEPEHPALNQPPLIDESAVYFAGPRVLVGLNRITRRQMRPHLDALEQALDRGQSLQRAMDRLDG